MSRLRCSSVAIRRVSCISSELWYVSKGLAAAPPGVVCSVGVSISRKPRASR
jgi:hypothetical protein